MNLIHLLNSDLMELPKDYDSYPGSFDEFLEEIFDKYQRALDALRGPSYLLAYVKSLIPRTAELCEAVRICLKEYLHGYPSTAYQVLATELDKNKALLDSMCSVEIAKELTHLYQVRKITTSGLPRSALFHVGFEHRHLVATARYSIPGLPCLYLGGSIWLCWKEVLEPDVNELSVSRFQACPTTKCRVLDFGFRPGLWAAMLASGKYTPLLRRSSKLSRLVAAHVICWPLVAASSIKVRYAAPFRAEYIVPQLILQWLTRETEMDGIRYFSTKVTAYPNDPVPAANFVFPARKVTGSGYCTQLASKFWLSDPLPWKEIKLLPASPKRSPHLNFKIETPSKLIVSYGSTDWAAAQDKLANLPCGPL